MSSILNTPSVILIYSVTMGFIRLAEGTGDNLLFEDIDNGYVDYIMVDFLDTDGYEFIETGGSQIMLTEMYKDKFHSAQSVVNYVIKTGFIPDVEYEILFTSNGKKHNDNECYQEDYWDWAERQERYADDYTYESLNDLYDRHCDDYLND